MPLTDAQRTTIEDAARREGVSIDELVAAAEEALAEDDQGPASTPAPVGDEGPKLFQYHLPFIRVRELRQNWLGLSERIADDDLPCGQWLTKHGGALGGGSGATPEPAE